jgi:hypothetical protein
MPQAAGTPSDPHGWNVNEDGKYGPPRATRDDPSLPEVTAITLAGAQAIDPETQTPAQAEEASRRAMERQARELKVTLDPVAVSAIAEGTIAELERRGAFAQPEPAQAPAAESAAAASVTEPAAPGEQPPAKKTLAQKMLG